MQSIRNGVNTFSVDLVEYSLEEFSAMSILKTNYKLQLFEEKCKKKQEAERQRWKAEVKRLNLLGYDDVNSLKFWDRQEVCHSFLFRNLHCHNPNDLEIKFCKMIEMIEETEFGITGDPSSLIPEKSRLRKWNLQSGTFELGNPGAMTVDGKLLFNTANEKKEYGNTFKFELISLRQSVIKVRLHNTYKFNSQHRYTYFEI